MMTAGFFDSSKVDSIMDESLKMKHFDHPNVLGLIGVCLDAGPAPYMVMPYMANGSLLHYLKKERPHVVLSAETDDDVVSLPANLNPCHDSKRVVLLLESKYLYCWSPYGS